MPQRRRSVADPKQPFSESFRARMAGKQESNISLWHLKVGACLAEYVGIHMSVCVLIYTHIYRYIYTYVYIYIYTYMNIYVYTIGLRIYTRKDMCIMYTYI